MRIIVNKELQPQVRAKIDGVKSMEQYNFDGYSHNQLILQAPSSDLVLNVAVDIARLGVIVEAYEYWVEIPDTNINDDLPDGLSYQTTLNPTPPPTEINRTWADLGLLAQGTSNSLRYWQDANNGNLNWNDVELIEEAGFTVYGHQTVVMRLNEDEYADIGDPEYVVLETIEWIDKNWRYGGYFDLVHAWLRMQELYEAKDTTDALRWAASTAIEKEILVRWNQVGLNRAVDLVDPSWSEARGLKEINRKYKEFSFTLKVVLEGRFDTWYQYLNVVFSGTGRTKFESDWSWDLKEEYVSRFTRSFELTATNKLLDWSDTVLSTYLDADFVGTTLTAAQIVAGIRKVLANKTYFV